MPLFRRGSSGRGRSSEARANGEGGSAAAAASPAATVATAGFLVTPQSAPAPTSASTATPSAPVALAPPLLSAPQTELAGLATHTNNPSVNATVASATVPNAPSVLSDGAERATPVSEHHHHQPQQGATTPRKAATAQGEENERPPQPAPALEGPVPPLPVVVVAPVEQGSAGLASDSSAAPPAQPGRSSSGRSSMAAAGPLPLASPPVDGVMSPPPAPPSSQPVTPWGEASDEPTKPPSRVTAAAPALEPGAASSSLGLGKETTSITAARAVAAQQQPEPHTQPGGGSLSTTALTGSALRELGGLRKGPSADREDSISLEERKQRVVEGMRRSSRVASEALAVVAADAAAAAAAAAARAAPATAEEADEPESDVYVFQGRVKMARRRWYMLLNAGRGGKVGRRLDFYATRADLEARRPPKESICLSPGCIVESRRLPLPSAGKGLGAVVPGAHTGSGGAPSSSSSSSSSSAAATFRGSYSAGATPISTAQGASFSETLEPDSVIDLLIPTSSGGKGLRTLTLQCFSVAEENRWISELQLAIGALHEADDDALLGLEVGRDSGLGGRRASRSVDLSRPMAAPQVCCVVS